MSKVKGMNGSVEFTGKAVVISRTGGGTKTVPLTAIQGVEVKKGGLTVGYIRFDVAGAQVASGKIRNKAEGLLKDANTVTFQFPRNAEFQALADEITAALYA